MPAHRVVEERRVHLAVEVFARLTIDRQLVRLGEAPVVVVPLLQVEGDPANLVLHDHDLQPREAVQHTVKDQIEERVGGLGRLQVHAAAVVLRASPRLELLAVVVAGQDMKADRHLQVLCGGPQFVVMIRAQRQIRMWRLPDQRTSHAHLPRALELRHRMVDVVGGDAGETDEPVRGDRAVLDEPVVVGAEARLLQRRVVQPEQP